MPSWNRLPLPRLHERFDGSNGRRHTHPARGCYGDDTEDHKQVLDGVAVWQKGGEKARLNTRKYQEKGGNYTVKAKKILNHRYQSLSIFGGEGEPKGLTITCMVDGMAAKERRRVYQT
jgi:hypothetical protein